MRPTWGATLFGFAWRHRIILWPMLAIFLVFNTVRDVIVPVASNSFEPHYAYGIVMMNRTLVIWLICLLVIQSWISTRGTHRRDVADEILACQEARQRWANWRQRYDLKTRTFFFIQECVVFAAFLVQLVLYHSGPSYLVWFVNCIVLVVSFNILVLASIGVSIVVSRWVDPWIDPTNLITVYKADFSEALLPGTSVPEIKAARASHEPYTQQADLHDLFDDIVNYNYPPNPPDTSRVIRPSTDREDQS